MGCRKNAIKLLNRLLETNEMCEKEYLCTAEHAKKLWFRNFFIRLGLQKRKFCSGIKKEIEILENEIRQLGGEVDDCEVSPSKLEQLQLPSFRFEKDELLRKCYCREKSSLKMYNFLLSQISTGTVRDMLLYQRHAISVAINEIESMGLHIFEETHDEEPVEEDFFKNGSYN